MMIYLTRFRRPLAAAAALLMSLMLVGSLAASEGDTLVVGYGPQPPSLDPHVTTVIPANTLARNIFETLVTLDEDMKIQPGLAQSWSVSEDRRMYRFTLRQGVKFHNGQPLTATDAVASLERWQRYSLPGKNVFQGSTWRAEGEQTVVLSLPTPRFNVLDTLASGIAQSAVIMPASIATAAAEKPVTQYIGTGPFRLVDWQQDQMMELQRYEGYTSFGGTQSGTAGDRTPACSKIQIVFVKDESTRTLGLSTGEYDVANPLPYDSITEVQENDALKLGSYASTMLNLSFNQEKSGFFRDKRARQAINIGIDRLPILAAAVIDQRFFRLNNHLMMRNQKQWTTEIGDTEFNPVDASNAKRLLKEAGYDGRQLILITTRDYVEMYNSAIVIQQQLQNLGVNVKVESYDWATFVKVRANKEAWDLMVLSVGPKSDPSQLVSLNKDFPGGPRDMQLEDILARIRKAATMEDAQDLYRKLEAWNQSYVPSVRIGEVDYVFAMSKRVQSIQVQNDLILWTTRLSY
ncbi:ABC transporter substrate-binding protein [Mesorhizobium opportunistum]|uniref:ABC transporter substrate-binding protein n=1 Tax=Mesorhizobium opportunistum TaxID=593909 RepID=UPI003336EAA3